MYESFYSLSAMPFQLTPDSSFYFGSMEHRKAMAFLQYGLAQQEGFVVITGEIGAGKTTLVEQLLSTLDPERYVVARVVTTQLAGFDTLCMIGAAFGIYREGMDKATLITALKKFFDEMRDRRKQPLIVVDEAQSLTLNAIEELRMLSNLSQGARAPFQGVFLGQPEFRSALSKPELQQLRQRVIASCHLSALGREDTRRYIEHRLSHVGWTGDPGFSNDAFEEIFRSTGGIPRRINTLCSRLLLMGFLDERHAIDASAVARVAREQMEEFGGSTAAPAELPREASPRPETGTEMDILLSILGNFDRASEKERRRAVRMLDVALKHFAGRNEK
jgi:putative secretion ATPase (PEP-CTERM system associated)